MKRFYVKAIGVTLIVSMAMTIAMYSGEHDGYNAVAGGQVTDQDGDEVENPYVNDIPTDENGKFIFPTTKSPVTTKKNPVTTKKITKKITVSKTKVKKLQNIKGKKVKVSLNKVKKAGGYQIKYSTSKKFKKYKKKNTKNVQVTLKKLKKGKNYYVKARAYRVVKGKTYYSSWCKTSKVLVAK